MSKSLFALLVCILWDTILQYSRFRMHVKDIKTWMLISSECQNPQPARKSKELSGIVHPMCVSTNVPFPFYNKVIRCKPYLDSAGYFQSSDQYKLPSYRCLESNSMYPKSEPQAHCPTQTCSRSFLVTGSMIKQLSLFAGGCLCIKYYFSTLTLVVTLSSFWLLGIYIY